MADSPGTVTYRAEWGRAFGTNAALILARLDYWLRRATKRHAGHRWVYKTYHDLGDELGMTGRQVRTALERLRDLGVVVAIRNPHVGWDKTLWWRVDARRRDELVRTTRVSRDVKRQPEPQRVRLPF